jgi:agmatinase
MKLYTPQYTFCYGGYSNAPFKKAKVVVVPIPYEGTVTYGSGTAKGPAAIIEASCHMETYDIELQQDFITKVGVHTLDPFETNFESPALMMDNIQKAIKKIIDFKKFPFILGGEHSITPPCVKSLKEKYKDLTVVQLDAHADMRDSFNGTKYSHACAMRRCREITDVVQIGIRSMSLEEADYLKKNKINTIFYSPEIEIDKILPLIKRNVYLTIDLDVLNPALMPAVGTPEPGGLTWYPFINLIKSIITNRTLVGADIVELSPIPGLIAPDFMAAVIAYKIMGYKFALKKVK